MTQDIRLDAADLRLLRQLQRDASLPLVELAESVNMSRSACWRRLQRLRESRIIRQQVMLLNPAALGLSLTVFISVRTNHHNAAWSRQFRKVIDNIPGVLEAYRMGGDVDYLLKAVVADMPDYDRLYQELIAADLFDVSAGFVMEELKNTTSLPL